MIFAQYQHWWPAAPGFEQGVEFLTEALEFGEGASSAKFRGPNGQVYELWRPEERYRMGSQ